MPRNNLRLVASGAVAAIVLAAASTVAVAAFNAPFGQRTATRFTPGTRCASPAATGNVVDVTLSGMGTMMGGASHGGPMMGGGYGPRAMMRVTVNPGTVPTGRVTVQVMNAGAMTHELVVLPLDAGQTSGQRSIGSDGRVDEAGILGEASRTCGEGAGEGIAPGSASWVTLTLPPGSYELVCNLPGHYLAGMSTTLVVT